MKYSKKTIFDEFRHWWNYGNIDSQISLLNRYYDKVKGLSIEKVKSLLPIDHHGFCESYHEPWMVHDRIPTNDYPFALSGEVWNWYGDRTTCSILTAVANDEDTLYRRMLVMYISYLDGYRKYDEKEILLIEKELGL